MGGVLWSSCLNWLEKQVIYLSLEAKLDLAMTHQSFPCCAGKVGNTEQNFLGEILERNCTRNIDDHLLVKCILNFTITNRFDPDQLPHYPVELLKRREILGTDIVPSDSESDLEGVTNILQVTTTERQRLGRRW